MCRMTLALLLRADGSWPYLDDDRFTALAAESASRPALDDDDGTAAHRLHHPPAARVRRRPDHAVLEVWGMDAERADGPCRPAAKTGRTSKDSDIATEVFQSYGLTPTSPTPRSSTTRRCPRSSSARPTSSCLKRLALRNGFECYVDGDTGHFGPPTLSGTPQPVLAVQFGDETTVNHFRLEVNALAPTDVAMYQLDHVTGDLLDATADCRPASRCSVPGSGADLMLPAGIEHRTVVSQTVATGAPEMAALCQGLHDRGDWFVTGEGEVAANSMAPSCSRAPPSPSRASGRRTAASTTSPMSPTGSPPTDTASSSRSSATR